MGLIKLFGYFASKQFQKTPTGYVYRYNAKGPPVTVTADDYDHYVRRAGWSFVFHVAGFMLAVIAAAMLTAHWFPSGDEAGGIVLMGVLMAGIMFASIKSLAWSMRAPERERREPLEPYTKAPARPQRPAGGRTRKKPAKDVSGWVYLSYFLAEIIGGATAAVVAYRIFQPDEDAATGAAIITFFVTIFVIDRICVRHTGDSIIAGIAEPLSFIP